MQKLFLALAALIGTSGLFAQKSILEGYVYETNNRGFLRDAKVSIYTIPDNYVRGDFFTDSDGHFQAKLEPGLYRLVTKMDLFYPHTDTVEVTKDKTFAKIELERKPGYLFDATIAESRTSPAEVVDAVTGTRIEIYNRTKRRPELVLLDHPNAFFQFTFEQGNHYTLMIRKPGYIAKRIEALVNVEGCIICVDGVREVNPGVTEVLTANNSMGTLLSNIEMEKVKLDKRITIRNIYYDFDKWDIRPDAAKQLNKVVTLMTDNPSLSVELGSHTDARGRDSYNDTLSQHRAEAAVEYIISQGVPRERITAKGYGETQLTNRCGNDVNCSEEEHQLNRRTELRITGIANEADERNTWKPLEEIIRQEAFDAELRKLGDVKEVKIGSDGKPVANKSVPLPEKTGDNSSWGWKGIPTSYGGFMVEFMDSNAYLDPKKTSVDNLGQPVFFQKDKAGKYRYYLGKFDSKVQATEFLEAQVRAVYPNAKVVAVKKGLVQ